MKKQREDEEGAEEKQEDKSKEDKNCTRTLA